MDKITTVKPQPRPYWRLGLVKAVCKFKLLIVQTEAVVVGCFLGLILKERCSEIFRKTQGKTPVSESQQQWCFPVNFSRIL